MTCLTTTLMSHQKAAVDKLLNIRVGALYMDMGTGKTRVALELAIKRLQAGKVNCIIWMCPVSVKPTIANEIKKHCTDEICYEIINTKPIKNESADIYIVGIESLSSSVVLNDTMQKLVESRLCFLIADESILIKNHRAMRTKSIWRLGEQCRYRLILNGTPISNNYQDLYSQWYFLDRRILGYSSFYSFAANHLEFDPDHPGRVVRAHHTKYLTNKIAPYIYQIRKHECLTLPDKTYSSRYYSMTADQRYLYDEAKNVLLYDVEEFTASTIYRLFNALQKIVSGKHYETNEMIFKDLSKNPRIKLLMDTIELLSADDKVIIWCKYKHEIESVCKTLSDEYGVENVTQFWGGVSQKNRIAEEERFRTSARFLVANKECAGYGLNLQFCQYAIYYSNNWTFATRQQSEDRIHRVGQTDNVHIIDIVCENSIDERIINCLSKKENLILEFQAEIDKQKSKIDLGRWIDNAA